MSLHLRVVGHGRRAFEVSLRFLRQRARRLLLAFVGVALPLMLFAEFAEEVHEGEAFEFDTPFLLSAHARATPGLDQAMVLGSELGFELGVIPVDILLVALLLATRRLRKGLFAAVAIGGSALLNLAAKAMFQRERPELWLSIAPEHTYSFPSGHAMGSATLAATVLLLVAFTRWRWPALLLGLAFMVWVGASRVYLGVHYPSDILAGWAAAITWVCAAYLIVRPNTHHGQAAVPARSPSMTGDGDRPGAADADRPGGADAG